VQRLRGIVVDQARMGGTVERNPQWGRGHSTTSSRCVGVRFTPTSRMVRALLEIGGVFQSSRNRVGIVRPLCNHVGGALQEAKVHARHVLAEYAQDEELNAREDCDD
jgi:hypothetical protein